MQDQSLFKEENQRNEKQHLLADIIDDDIIDTANRPLKNGRNGSYSTSSEWKSIHLKINLQKFCDNQILQQNSKQEEDTDSQDTTFSDDYVGSVRPIVVDSKDQQNIKQNSQSLEQLYKQVGQVPDNLFSKDNSTLNINQYFQNLDNSKNSQKFIVQQLLDAGQIIDQNLIAEILLKNFKQIQKHNFHEYELMHQLLEICPMYSLFGQSKLVRQIIKQKHFYTQQILFQNIEHIKPKDLYLLLESILQIPFYKSLNDDQTQQKQKQNGRHKITKDDLNWIQQQVDSIYNSWFKLTQYKLSQLEEDCINQLQKKSQVETEAEFQRCGLLKDAICNFPQHQVLLHNLVTLPIDRNIMSMSISKLDARNSLLFFKYLHQWLQILINYSLDLTRNGFKIQQNLDAENYIDSKQSLRLGHIQKIPTLDKIIQWLQAFFDAKFGILTMEKFQQVAQSILDIMEQVRKENDSLINLQGSLSHIKDNKQLPQTTLQESQCSFEIVDLD